MTQPTFPRADVVVLHDVNRSAIHFTGTKLQGDDLWIPFDPERESLHWFIETILTMNNIAHNVTSVERIRQCGRCDDYRVVYNRLVA